MHKLLIVIGFCLVTFLGVISCYDEHNTFGDRLVDSDLRNISMDTSTIVMTAVLIDSLETSGKQVVLAGRYAHPVWGRVSAASYIPYMRPQYSTEADVTVKFDSLMLVLSSNGDFVGDTTLQQRYSIHLLTEKIILNDNGYLYNNSSFAYESEPMASYSFIPRPHVTEKLEIRLPDELGQDLLNRFHNHDESVAINHFEDYFKGIVIMPDEKQSYSLLSFQVSDSLSALVLHYHIEGGYENQQKLVFSPNTTTQFNQLIHERHGTPMEPYPLKKVEIPSEKLGNRGILFSGIGWYTRLEFPYLNNIMEQGEYVHIEKAGLKIYPEYGTYSGYNALPDSIFLYIAEENNVVTDAVKDYLGKQVQGGKLVKDDLFLGNTYYYFDVTKFMKDELGTSGKYKHNLQLVFNSDDYTKTLKNLTFGDPNGQHPIILQLNYKIYESY